MDGISLRDFAVMVIMGLSLGLVPLLCWWEIVQRMGFPAPMSTLLVVPGINLLALIYLAIADWPALRKLRETQDDSAPPGQPS